MFSPSKDNTSHVKKVEAVRYAEKLTSAAIHILDLEALYHNNMLQGFDMLDQLILKNCKRKMSIALHELNLFNLYIKNDEFKLFSTENDPVLRLKKLPRVLLSYNPRSTKFTGEPLTDIEADNNRVNDAVQYINNILVNSKCHEIVDVRSRYTSDNDGFLIEINFSSNLTEQIFIDKIETFIEEAQSLSLDELMISQQFSDWYTLQHKNPYWLHQNNTDQSQTILISIFNIHCFSPSYFLSTLLDNLKNKVLLRLENQILNLTDTNHSQQLLIKDQYSSINDSFVIFNISFEVKGKQNE